MERVLEIDNVNNQLSIKENLTIHEVGEITQSIKTTFDNGKKLSINLADIQRIDTAGAQLLCTIVNEAKNKNIEIVWEESSSIVEDSLSQLGLLQIMNIVPNKI